MSPSIKPAAEAVVVVRVRREGEVLAEALVAVFALERLVHRRHLAGLGSQLVDDCKIARL